MSDYLLDTHILIDILRGDPKKTALLSELVSQGSILHSCEITVAEIYSGMREKEREATEKFLASLEYLSITEPIAKLGGDLRRRHKIHGKNITLPDALITALAIHQHLVLLTDNIKDFPMSELKKEKP